MRTLPITLALAMYLCVASASSASPSTTPAVPRFSLAYLSYTASAGVTVDQCTLACAQVEADGMRRNAHAANPHQPTPRPCLQGGFAGTVNSGTGAVILMPSRPNPSTNCACGNIDGTISGTTIRGSFVTQTGTVVVFSLSQLNSNQVRSDAPFDLVTLLHAFASRITCLSGWLRFHT